MSRGRTSSGLRPPSPARRRESVVATGGPRELVTSQHSPQLYVKVPVSTIRNPGITRFIVSITLSDGRVIERKTGTVDMQTQLKDLSTASMNTAEGQAQHDLENRILNQVLKNFPINVSDGVGLSGWHRTIVSDYHVGIRANAIDLNFDSGSKDANKPVIAVDDGVVVVNEVVSGNSTLILEHTLADGKTKYYSVYLHMQLNSDGKTVGAYKVGDTVSARAEIGRVGHVGAGENNDHLHFELRTTEFGPTLEARKVLETLNIPTRVEEASRKMMVTWDNNQGMWKATEADSAGIFFQIDGSPATNGVDNVWVALVDGDKSKAVGVGWEKATFIDDKGVLHTDTFTWLRLDNKNKRWNGIKFVSLIP